MDIPRRDFLARASRARQHHAPVGFCNLVQLSLEGAERRTIAKHIGIGHITTFKFNILAAQLSGFHCAANNDKQLVDIKRFFDEIVGTLFDRRDSNFDIAVT